MKKKGEAIIFPDSTEAAQYRTGIEGWISRLGRFYGKEEDLARYDGSTHSHCKCGAVVKKNSYCGACAERGAQKRWEKLERRIWDGETPLYSDAYQRYLFDPEDIDCLQEEYDLPQDSDSRELRLVLCEPAKLRTLDIDDFWYDDLPDGMEVPNAIREAAEKLNEVIRSTDAGIWTDSNVAIVLKDSELEDER